MIRSIWYRRILVGILSLSGLVILTSLLGLVESQNKSQLTGSFSLQLEDKEFLNNLPLVTWKDSGAQNVYLEKDISKSYGMASKLLNTCRNQGIDRGLSTYFTNHFIETSNFSIQPEDQRVHLFHNLKTVQLSSDQSWIKFLDSSQVVFSRDKNLVYNEVRQVIMELTQDGWKVDEITVLHSQLKEEQQLDRISAALKNGVNYYPSQFPWLEFWSNFDISIVERDLKKVKELNFDHIRIFIPYRAHVHTDLIRDINRFYKLSDSLDLKVVSTLFDFPDDYSPSSYPLHYKYLCAIIEAEEGSEQPIMYDLKNEPDLDFSIHGATEVNKWIGLMSQILKEKSPEKALTCGWSSMDYVHLFQDDFDVLSFHYYEDVEKLEDWMIQKKKKNFQYLVSEYGRPGCKEKSLVLPDYNDQKDYLSSVKSILNTYEIPGTIWCYSDYRSIPNYVFGRNPWTKYIQSNYGIVDVRGEKKWND